MSALLKGQKACLVMSESALGSSSDQQSVLVVLPQPAPRLELQPVVVVDGQVQPHEGFTLPTDPAFANRHRVLGASAPEITAWLGPALREVLKGLPGVWLRLEGSRASITLHGFATRDDLNALAEAGLLLADGPVGVP